MRTGGQWRRGFAVRVAGRVGCLCLIGAGLALLPLAARSATVTVKILAVNKKPEKQPVSIRQTLPEGATPDAVISLGELELSYDVATRTYYVHKQVELGPRESRVFEVVLNDTWVIPEKTLTELGDHAKALVASTKDAASAETGQKVGALVDEALKGITERQRAYAIGVVKAVDHIRAYETNLKALDQVRKDVGVLENLVIAAGKDPGAILGMSLVAPPSDDGAGSRTDQVIVIRIKVTNPSLTEKQAPTVRQDLPAEVGPTDIVDPGGLQVGFDAARGVTYVYAEAVELAPQQSREFEVKLKNPWGGADARVEKLRTRVTELAETGRKTQAYDSVTNDIGAVARDLASLATNKPPATLNEDYVAFARRRTDQLRGLEARIIRLEELFHAHDNSQISFSAPLLDVKPPSRQTTWRIIWVILAFLGAFSVLFFLRWYGRSKAETMDRRGPGPANPTAPSDSGSSGRGPAAP